MNNGSQFGIVRICLLAAGVGVLAGFAAEALHRLIGLVTNLAFYQRISHEIVSPLDSPLGAGIILIPALGGLIVGFIAKYGTPLVRGHGIPEAIEAVLLRKSRIHPKVALLKPISAAVSLGSGQPFGAEGPIIQTGAAIGSLLGQAFQTTAVERKVLLACGSAAGLSAIFGTPVAAVIFAIELLLFEFRARSFIPLVIASTIAAEIHMLILGSDPVFAIGEVGFGRPRAFLLFLLLGLICGGVAMALTKLLYWIEDGYHHLPFSTYLYPTLGGLFVGIVGYLAPRLSYAGIDVFGPGYYVIENILNSEYSFGFLMVLLLCKGAVWLVALGSGTSGGTLAPIFMIGASVGGMFGIAAHELIPGLEVTPAAFALAGMAAVFGSSTRATFASIVFAFEMTRSYEAILPLMFTCVIADLLVTRFMTTSLLTEQLRRSGVLVHHEYEADLLNMVAVGAVMNPHVTPIAQQMTVAQVVEQINLHDPALNRHQGLLITDEKGCLTGIITRNDLRRAIHEGREDQAVIEAGSRNVIVSYPDMSVHDAMLLMFRHDIGRLPVVERDDPRQIVGYLSRTHVLKPYLQKMQDESDLEPGWVQLQFERLAQREA